MAFTTIISGICVLAGGAVMTRAVVRARAIPQLLEGPDLRQRWCLLIGLMVFFLAGYGLTLYVLATGNHPYLELLTGVVFLFGAAFVFVTVSVGHDSIAFLESRVNQRTEELAKASTQARAANRAKTDFLSNMSHELRTPLNSIIGFSELLNDRSMGELNEKQLRYTNNVLNSGQHLLQLINDILDVTRIESGTLELDLRKVQAGRTAAEVCEALAGAARESGITLTCTVPKLPAIMADPTRLRQILFNLIGNALKFTPEGGLVQVEGKRKGDLIELTVTDNGVGIAPKDQSLIFHQFQQLESGLDRKNDGVGLGLYVTKKLVESQNGYLTLKSEGIEGQGCEFAVMFPLA